MMLQQVEQIHVHIGQVKIGRPGQHLNAILGSCIGLGFLVPKRQIYGLSHSLLSKSPTPITELGAKFVDQAVHSLLELMEITPEEKRKVEVLVAGGGNLTGTDADGPGNRVGAINAEFAIKAVRANGLRVRYQDLGGNFGRKVEIDCDTGKFEVKTIPRLGVEK